MKTLLFLVLIAPCLLCGQDDRYVYNCSSLQAPSAGCNSYNEMVRGADKSLMEILTKNSTFVCFRPYQDVFFVLAYSEPKYEAFVKETKTGFYEADAYVFYDRFNNGISEDSRFFAGKWKKFVKDGQTPLFYPLPIDEGQGIISESEVGLQYVFTNLENTKTIYSVNVRRSTQRFLESFQWETPHRDSKAKGKNSSEAPDSPMGSRETGGYCAFYAENSTKKDATTH